MRRRSMALLAAMFTVRDLIGGLLVGVAIGGLIDAFGKPVPWAARGLAIIVTTSIVVLSARMWGGHIARLANGSNAKAASRNAAFTVGPLVLFVALTLAAIEPVAVARSASAGLGVHVVYTMLFVPATLLIAAVGAFALGRGLYDTTVGLRLALGAGIAAAAAFLAVDWVMDAFGWRVGGPDAARRATMVVVTSLGLLAAGIAGGASIGALLPRVGTAP